MSKLKRGYKHPTKDLIFYQYHHPYYKETNGEVWLSPNEYYKRVSAHSKGSVEYRIKYPLMVLTSNAIQRDKSKYSTAKKDLIDVKFITKMFNDQEGVCYWYNIKMDINKSVDRHSRNPLKVTIDRLDNNKGYSKDNVVLASYAANCGRGNMDAIKWINVIKIIKDGLSKTSP